MKYLALLFCVLLGTSFAVPRPVSHTPALDVLGLLEKVVEHEGQVLLEKVIEVIHAVQGALLELKSSVPKVYEKFHQEVDEVLEGLRTVYGQVDELLGKKDVAYGFDLLGGLTELTGGTKLSTILSLISLADKAHRVVNDAKEFVPHLEKTLNRIQEKITVSVTVLTKHVVSELGLQYFIAQSMAGKVENLMEDFEEESHALILDLAHNVEQTLNTLKVHLPEVYETLKERVEEVMELVRDIVGDVEKALNIHILSSPLNLGGAYSLLDIAGDFTGGTSLGTAFKVMSLIDKFNTVVQDARQFGPRAEALLERSVKKVADSAQAYLSHLADKLMT